MKCINCRNEIPNSSSVCPFCNTAVTPLGTPEITTMNENVQPAETKVEQVNEQPSVVQPIQNDMSKTSQIPVTPTEPVLPQDQGMEMTNIQEQDLNPVQPEISPVIEETLVENPIQSNFEENNLEPLVVEPVINTNPVVEDLAVPKFAENEIAENVESASEVVIPQTPVEQPIEEQVAASVVKPIIEQPSEPMIVDQTQVAQEQSIEEPVIAPEVAVPVQNSEPMTTASVNPVPENENGSNGVKIGSAAPVIEKNNKKAIIIAVIAIVVAIILGFGTYFYIHEFKSGNKKIDALVDNLFVFTNNITKEKINVSSGNYDINMTVNDGKNKYSTKLNGSYGIDINKKIMDYKINVESINLGQELIPETLKLEMYSIDSKAYILLSNFYDKYIYTDIEGMEDVYTSLKENDINYQLVIQTYKNSVKNSIKAMNYSESIETRNIDGKDKKVNVLKIQFTKANQKVFIDTLVNNLINSEEALKEIAKISGETVDDLKKGIKTLSEDIKYIPEDTMFELYTPILRNDYAGIKANFSEEKDKYSIVITPVNDTTKLVINENNNELVNINVKNLTTITKDTKDAVFNIAGSINADKNKYSFELGITVKEDLTPNVENVNVRNSINYQYLTPEDINGITTKISNFGVLGSMLSSYLGNIYTTQVMPNTDATVDESTVVFN